MDPHDIGSMIRQLRMARGWSLAELARRAGTSAPTVHRYESDWRRFELSTLRKLATALGCNLCIRLEPIAADAQRLEPEEIVRRLKRLFWDHRLRPADLVRYRTWVIQRVLEYGNLEDVTALERHYGREVFLDLVARIHFGSRKTRVFWEEMLRQEGRPCTRKFSRAEAGNFWTI